MESNDQDEERIIEREHDSVNENQNSENKESRTNEEREDVVEENDDNDDNETVNIETPKVTTDKTKEDKKDVEKGEQAVSSKSDTTYGCEHYKRKSKFVTPCCNKIYTCRFCHDENESHAIKRKEVTELICVLCDTRQPVQERCNNCNVRFGNYTCLECNLFDDEDKKQYHCEGCGICRLGGRDRFFHCTTCDMCLPVELKNKHKCVENVSRANCPVCMEDIHTSRIPCHIPDCGHLIHRVCFEQLLHSGHYVCPTCQECLLDMTHLWNYLDNEVAHTPMPQDYIHYKAEILCKDCHKEAIIPFHVVGLKCPSCGGYNTCKVKRCMFYDPPADAPNSKEDCSRN